MAETRNVAVVDVGSNSIKLLVAHRDPETGLPAAGFTATAEVRISAGIGRAAPRLGEEGMRAGIAAIAGLLEQAAPHRPRAVAIVATSAVRDAANREAFAAAVEKACGHPLTILGGGEEAALVGAGLLCDPAVRGMDTFFQADLGGGSLELVGFARGAVTTACSLPLGAVRLTEELVPDPRAPIDGTVLEAVRTRVGEALAASGFSFGPKHAPLLGTGGSVVVARRVLAGQQTIAPDDSDRFVTRAALAALCDRLRALTADERAALPGLPANRADVLPTALTTLETLLDTAGRDGLVHSFYNLRYGVARKLLDA